MTVGGAARPPARSAASVAAADSKQPRARAAALPGTLLAVMLTAVMTAACGERTGAPLAASPSAMPTPAAAGAASVAAKAAVTTQAATLPPHEQGRAIYNFRCYYCHGYSGDAKTLAATLVDPPPRNFAALSLAQLPRERMLAAVRDGVAGTAMAGFGNTVSAREIELVVDFVRDEFIRNKAPNTRYHTAENGWPGHERYRAAFPFATGELALDTRWEALSPAQQAGKRLYLSACVSCHDRARVNDAGAPWALRGVSYPPGNYESHEEGYGGGHAHERPADPDDPYDKHETPPALASLTPGEQLGEIVFQSNCAYCHAANGSGQNWIGSFLDPSPPDFRRAAVMQVLTRERLLAATREGIANSSMPAWKSVLSEREIDAVVAYVERAWGVPR